jgi:SAM-dependent methyltransferase
MRHTEETRRWLDATFSQVRDGVPVTHQPVWGIASGRATAEQLPAFVRAFAQLRLLSRCSGETLLDVGAAEGWLAWLARELLGFRVAVTDLSPRGVLRARLLFGIDGAACDAASLPFAAGDFDVVVCSETLEHLERPVHAALELDRVALRHVLLTTECVHHDDASRARALAAREDAPHEDLNHLLPGELADLLTGEVRLYNQMERLHVAPPRSREAVRALALSTTRMTALRPGTYGAMALSCKRAGILGAPRLGDEELLEGMLDAALDPNDERAPSRPDPELRARLCAPDLADAHVPPLEERLADLPDRARAVRLLSLAETLRFDREVCRELDWHFAPLAPGWEPGGGLKVGESGALLVEGESPRLVGPRVEFPLGAVRKMDLELCADRAGIGQVFWMTSEEPWFDEARSFQFAVPASAEPQRVELRPHPASAQSDATVIRLRLDPLAGPGLVRIARLRVLTG